jgi:hypothetical protein
VDDEIAWALQLTAIVETGLNGRAAAVVKVIAMPPARRAQRLRRVVMVIAISVVPVSAVEAAGQTATGIDTHAGITADLVVGGTRKFTAIVALDGNGGVGLG